MSHFDVEMYSRIDSPLHRWEPRIKLISLFVLIFSVALAGDITAALAGLAVSITLILLSGLAPSHVAGFMKWPIIFLLPLIIFLPFTTGGEPLFAVGLLAPSSEGLRLGLIMLIRGLGAAILALMIVGTAPFNVTINSLRRLGLPSQLTQIFLFAYRYIFLLNEELQTMDRSLDSKGFIRRSDMRTARILALAVGMLLIRSYERSEDIFNAMLSRGYQGTVPASCGQRINKGDLFKSLMVMGAAILVQTI